MLLSSASEPLHTKSASHLYIIYYTLWIQQSPPMLTPDLEVYNNTSYERNTENQICGTQFYQNHLKWSY